VQGHWIAVPATVGSLTLPPCSRIDLSKQHVGLDLTRCIRRERCRAKRSPTIGPWISPSRRPKILSARHREHLKPGLQRQRAGMLFKYY
jgi:hypothetical protein